MQSLNGLIHQSEEKGEAFVYDVDFKGPKKQRSKTDVPFFWFFAFFVGIWIVLGVWTISTTDTTKDFHLNTGDTKFRRDIPDDNPPDFAKIVNKYWKGVMGGLALSMLAALLMVYLMRWLAAPILWSYIVTIHVICLIASISGFAKYLKRNNSQEEQQSGLGAGIIFAIIFIVLFLIVFFMRRRIKLALALIKEGSRAVCTMWSSVFFPIFPGTLKIIVIAFGLTMAINLSIKQQAIQQQESGENNVYVFIHAYNLVASIWVLFFISALTEITLAGTFGTWYWTYNKNEIPPNALTSAFVTSSKYHLGTIAFGSLTITICRVLRIIFGIGARDNGCSPMMCLRCFLSCIEKFLRRFNRNAYIMCAMHGRPLCASALSAYQLILRNVLRYVALDTVTGIVFGMSKLLLAGGTGAIGYACFYDDSLDEEEKKMIWIPVFVLALGTFFISSVFYSVYAMACETLVLCFLEDSERNDGSDARPYYMSKRLMNILATDSAAESYHPLTDDRAHYNNY